MKKIIIALVATGFAFSAKAQQNPLLARRQPVKQFSYSLDSLKNNNFSFNQLDTLRAKPALRFNAMANANIDNMPVARMQGNYNMPVVQTDRTGYNMPILGTRPHGVYLMTKPADKKQAEPTGNQVK